MLCYQSVLPSLLLATAGLITPFIPAHAQTLPQAQFDQPLLGAHDMKGTVTAIDHRSGSVQVSAGALDLQLHFPPPSVMNVQEGDTLVFRMGIKEVIQADTTRR